jgi:hypothetical protein
MIVLWRHIHTKFLRRLENTTCPIQTNISILVKPISAKLANKAMKTKHAVLPLVAAIFLATCVSGCTSTNPSGGQSETASGVPIYEPSVKTASVDTTQGKVTTYQTASSSTQVADFYKKEMANRGYQVTTTYQTRPSSENSDVVLSFAKGTNTVHIAIAAISAQIGPLNLSQAGATTFVITERNT